MPDSIRRPSGLTAASASTRAPPISPAPMSHPGAQAYAAQVTPWEFEPGGIYHSSSAGGHPPPSASTGTSGPLGLSPPASAPVPKRSGRISSLLSRKDRTGSAGAVSGSPSVSTFPGRGSQCSDHQLEKRTSTPASSVASSINLLPPSSHVGLGQSLLDVSDEPNCPVCLEPLSLRLHGERPHIVPQCGHAMHHECFAAMYGDPKAVLAAQEREEKSGAHRRSSQSSQDEMVCDVCRKLLVLRGERPGSKTAAMMGAIIASGHTSSVSPESNPSTDPAGDDKTDTTKGSGPMIHPQLEAISEHSPIYRKEPSGGGAQKLNVLVTVSVPGRRPLVEYGPDGRTLLPPNSRASLPSRQDSISSDVRRTVGSLSEITTEGKKLHAPPEEVSVVSSSPLSGESLRADVAADLNNRIIDWKGHQLEHFGGLQYFDTLSLVQGKMVRQFRVYLFEQALLCTLEHKGKHVSRYLSVPSSNVSDESGNKVLRSTPALQLKGRIYLRHIRAVVNSSTVEEAALSIKMVDETLPDFILVLHSERQAGMWKARIEGLIHNLLHPESRIALPMDTDLSGRTEELSSPHSSFSSLSLQQNAIPELGSSNSARMNSLTSRSASTARPSPVSSPQAAAPPTPCKVDALDRFRHDGSNALPGQPNPRLYPPVGVDLVIVVSIPPVPREGMLPTDVIRLTLLRSSLLFLLDKIGDKGRISLVAYRCGHMQSGGFVAKTRLLRPSFSSSYETLVEFLKMLAQAHDASPMGRFAEDLAQFPESGEYVDMASAVNVGADILLQRGSKNPLSSLLVVDDSPTGPKRGAMDRLCRRAEATGAGVHTFGLGAAHDPSPLWLIASHTKGSYTYLRRASELRIVLAGCVGALLSTALTDVTLRIHVDSHPAIRVRKPKFASGYTVSADGKAAEVPIGLLPYGCKRDVVFELELDFDGLYRDVARPKEEVDETLLQFGMDPALLATPEGEQAPLFVADVSYRDPRTQQQANRLPHPLEFGVELSTGSDPLDGLRPAQLAACAQARVTRRTMELLTSSLIANSLLTAPRNLQQATALLLQSRQMIESVLLSTPGFAGSLPRQTLCAARVDALTSSPESPGPSFSPPQPEHAGTVASLTGILEDLETILGVLEGTHTIGRSLSGGERFEREGRKFAAQQVTVLRTQRAWSSRTNTEHLVFKDDNGPALAVLAGLNAPTSPRRGGRGSSS